MDSSNKSFLIAGGVSVVVLAITLDAFQLRTYLAMVAGRLKVKKLIQSSVKEESNATCSGIFIYPVKSLKATAVKEATIDSHGLANDRRFMLVAPRPPPLLGSFGPGESTHQFITQRQVPTLATIHADLNDEGCLILSSTVVGPGRSVTIDPSKDGGTSILARIWDDTTEVMDMGDEAAAFLAEIVAQDQEAPPTASGIRLVAMKTNNNRVSNQQYTPPSALSWSGALPNVGLTDGFPVLIANEASLEELNRRLNEKGKDSIPMSRFRPNIVVKGAKPFEEDTWKLISIGGVVFHLVKGCPRCKQSCTDQDTGVVSKEPLETLAEFRALGPVKENIYFAQNAIPHETGGIVRVGAPIQVLERGNPVWDS